MNTAHLHRHLGWTVLVLALVPACSDTSDDPEAAGSSSPTRQNPPASSPTSGVVELSFLTDRAETAPQVSVEVPAGFVDSASRGEVTDSGAGWYVVSEDGQGFLGFYEMEQVYADACRTRARDRITPGASVRDLVQALDAQRATDASSPTSTTLAGHPSTYVELTGPADLDACLHPALGPERGLYVDDQVDRLWILELQGQRLVVDASFSSSSSSAGVVADLTAMVDSLELAS